MRSCVPCTALLVACLLLASAGWAQETPLAVSQKVAAPFQPRGEASSEARPAPASAAAGVMMSTGQPGSTASLQIGSGDLLEVAVFDTPELSQRVRVDNSGAITLAMGGDVHVAGLTAEQAKPAIEAALRKGEILRDPHVSVLIVEYATQGVSVLGEVKNPGVYPLLGQHTVLDLVSAAGGLTAYASKTVVLSHRGGSEETIDLSLKAASGGPSQSDAMLAPGDRIVVRRAGVVYVLGDVGKPGGYLTDRENTITVLQALALAQGINKTAQMNGALIRTSAMGRQQTQLELKRILSGESADPTLQDGDIVYVPVSGAKEWGSKTINSILQMAVGVVVYGVF